MNPEQVLHLLPYFGSVIVSLLIAIYAWQRRSVNGALLCTGITLGEGANTLAYILEITSNELVTKAFWDDVQWLTLATTTVTLVVFTFQFIGRPVARPGYLWVVLMIVPGIYGLLLILNQWGEVTRTNTRLLPGNTFSILLYDFTPFSWLMALYLLLLGGAVLRLLASRIQHSRQPYRAQIITVLIGVSLPVVGGLLTLAGVRLTNQRDLSPFTVALGNLVVAWGVFRYRLLEIVPVVRDRVFENLRDAVLVIDASFRLVDMNQAAAALLKRFTTPHPTIGVPLPELFPRLYALIADSMGNYTSFERETSFTSVTDAGTFIISVSPLHPGQSDHGGWVVQLKDISDRKQLEEQLVQYAIELETARRQAEDADQMKSQFLAIMSHELRTPLNAIINFNQFVSTGLFGPVLDKQVEALDKSTGSARYLLTLINDVLDLSKIEAGRMELAIEHEAQLNHEINEVVELIRPMLNTRPIELCLKLPDFLPGLSVDRKRFRQILLNLMSNAAKYTREGSICLQVAVDSTHVIFTIEDTGPGIPLEDQSAIFEPFRQLRRDRSRSDSTGLGLPITRRLVEAHGGTLWLKSAPGQGSCFFFSLPITSPDTRQPEAPENRVRLSDENR